jgi:hypothetical protein
VDSIDAAYRSLLRSANDPLGSRTAAVDKLDVSGTAYDLFYSAYQRSILGYNEGIRQRIFAYVQSFKSNPSNK